MLLRANSPHTIGLRKRNPNTLSLMVAKTRPKLMTASLLLERAERRCNSLPMPFSKLLKSFRKRVERRWVLARGAISATDGTVEYRSRRTNSHFGKTSRSGRYVLPTHSRPFGTRVVAI